MDQSRVDMFIMTSGENFPAYRIPDMRNTLSGMDESRFVMVESQSYYKPTLMLIISILGGSLGIDRFMLGEVGLGVLKLITCGGCGIWTIIDWFLVMDKTRDYNYKKFAQAAY